MFYSMQVYFSTIRVSLFLYFFLYFCYYLIFHHVRFLFIFFQILSRCFVANYNLAATVSAAFVVASDTDVAASLAPS